MFKKIHTHSISRIDFEFQVYQKNNILKDCTNFTLVVFVNTKLVYGFINCFKIIKRAYI